MGICLSTTKVSGSNSTNNNNNNTANKEEAKRQPHPRNETTTTTTTTHKQQHQERAKNHHQLKPRKDKANTRRQTGVISCGKRTDFGYAKDFDKKYTIGKLLGHGQFGYTYVATDKAAGDRVAVKKIEKNKVFFAYFCVFFVF